MHNPPRILIVDDNETNRDILRTRLGPQGYELLEAADGDEALAYARNNSVDLVLADVNMPRMDGITLVAHLRTLPAWPAVRFALCRRPHAGTGG